MQDGLCSRNFDHMNKYFPHTLTVDWLFKCECSSERCRHQTIERRKAHYITSETILKLTELIPTHQQNSQMFSVCANFLFLYFTLSQSSCSCSCSSIMLHFENACNCKALSQRLRVMCNRMEQVERRLQLKQVERLSMWVTIFYSVLCYLLLLLSLIMMLDFFRIGHSKCSASNSFIKIVRLMSECAAALTNCVSPYEYS